MGFCSSSVKSVLQLQEGFVLGLLERRPLGSAPQVREGLLFRLRRDFCLGSVWGGCLKSQVAVLAM